MASGIHINPANRGTFTESSKRAGQSVQAHARSVKANPRASAKQKKRAQFALNAAKWNKGRTAKRSQSRRSGRR